MKITDRIDHTNDMVGEWCSELPPCPKSVKISLDDHCQFKCTFCASGMNEVKARMDLGKFKRLVDELVANGTEEIGLFFIGEVLDVTGWLGGYNFQWAWSSGWVCGESL